METPPLRIFPAHAAIAILRLVPTLLEYFSSDCLGKWKPVSKLSGASWLVFYGLFLLYAALSESNFLIIDFANLAIHEAGHPLFSPFGYTMTMLGGTLAELIAPLACFSYFPRQSVTQEE